MQSLLIVPYGIETEIKQAIRKYRFLLIVPYGIETIADRTEILIENTAFNRTLWN